MSVVIGKVTSIKGSFDVQSIDGIRRTIALGDEIHEGDIVIGDMSNSSSDSITVNLIDDNTNVLLTGSDSQLFDSSLSSVEFSSDETITDVKSVENLVVDIDELETAAGEENIVENSGFGEAVFADVNNASADIISDLRSRENNIEQTTPTEFTLDIGEETRRILANNTPIVN